MTRANTKPHYYPIIIIVALSFLSQAIVLSLSLSLQSKLLVRQIRQQPSNVTHALNILAQIDTGVKIAAQRNPHDVDVLDIIATEALRVCGKTNKHELALEVYKKYPSETARTMLISVLGGCNQITKATELLEDYDDVIGPPSTASFNAMIGACGKVKDWELALDIYHNRIPKDKISALTINSLLTVLSRCRKGAHSLEIFNENMIRPHPTSNNNKTTVGSYSVTCTLVIRSLIRSNMLAAASKILEDLEGRQKHCCTRKSIEAMYDLVLSEYIQRSDWRGVEQIERIRDRNKINCGDDDDDDDEHVSTIINRENARSQNMKKIQNDHQFQQWKGLTKVGEGKESYWIIGTYLNENDTANKLNITVGTRPHRNPSRNGIQILFFENLFDEESNMWRRNKLGFLLMKNDSYDRASSMLGMFLTETDRGRGISKICLSIWILLCLEASLLPVTGVMHKPLLALILQHTFGFIGSPKKDGVLVELSRDLKDPKCVVLYSSSIKSLEGTFSPSDRVHQNIKLASQQPPVRGRMVRIGSKLRPSSNKAYLRNICEQILAIECWKCDLSCEEVQCIFLGKTITSHEIN